VPPIHGTDWTPDIAGDVAAADRSWLSDGVVPHCETAEAGCAAPRAMSSIERMSLTNEKAGTGGRSGMTGDAAISGCVGIAGIAGFAGVEGIAGIEVIPGMYPGSAISLEGSVP
jgi:hypothetical protein